MGYVLLWFEALAAYLLLVAAVLAVSKHRNAVWRGVMVFAAAGLPLVCIAGITVGLAEVRIRYHVFSGPYLGMVLLTIAGTAGLLFCLILGFRRVSPERARAFGRWPTGRLWLGWLVAVTLGVFTFWNLDLSMRARLATAHAEAGALALSVAPPRVADRHNAALIYEQAFARMWQQDDDPPEHWLALIDQINPDRATGDFDWTDASVTALIDEHGPTLQLLRRASALPDCYFERDYGSPSVKMLVPELNRFRNGAQMLAIEARHALATGHTQRIAENLNAIFRMAEHMQREPILIVGLTAVSLEHMAVQLLEEVLNDPVQSPKAVQTIELQAMVSYHRAIQRCFKMQEAHGLSTFSDFGSDSGRHLARLLDHDQNAILKAPGVAPIYRVFILPDDLVSFRRVMHQTQLACARPWWQASPKLMQIQREFETTGQGLMTVMIFPALMTAAQYFEEADARHNAARIALAMTRYAQQHGRYPPALGDLAPQYLKQVPNDPFTGLPFKLIQRGGMLVLYSIGADLKDDGGEPIHREPITMERVGDLVFRLPLIEP